VKATATNDNGATIPKTSAATAAVVDATPNIEVTIDGTAQEGQTLSARVSGAEGDDTLTYAWTSGATTLGTASTYTVQESDEGTPITL
jgi:hypothetical protein